MSTAPATIGVVSSSAPSSEDACPLCGSPLRPEQSWCLDCGAPARTRLAPAPDWRTPLIVVAAIIVLAAIGLTVALVKLTGGTATTTVTTGATPAAAAPAPGAPAATTPGAAAPAATAPAATTPAAPAPATSTPASKPARR